MTAVRELKEETELVAEPAALAVAGIMHGARGAEVPDGFLTVVLPVRARRSTPSQTNTRTWQGYPRTKYQRCSCPPHTALMNHPHQGPSAIISGF